MKIESIKEIYYLFRKAQADYNNRGFRMPKDFEAHFSKKLSTVNQKKLTKITGYFLTKWSNIDPYTYFKCGFDLYKHRFSYVKFFNERILMLYKQRDKNEKREIKVSKRKIIDSAKFLIKYMNENEIFTLQEYIDTTDGSRRLAVTHYLQNKIDASFFVWLIKKGMKLSDEDRSYIPYISKQYRTINVLLNSDLKEFLSKIEKKFPKEEKRNGDST
jgi:hypothetical protein